MRIEPKVFFVFIMPNDTEQDAGGALLYVNILGTGLIEYYKKAGGRNGTYTKRYKKN